MNITERQKRGYMRRSIKVIVAYCSVLILFAPVAAAADTGTVSVQTIPGQSLSEIVIEKAESSWPWFVIRASGLVAGVSLVILMLSGIGSVTGHMFRFLEPLTAWATHRALGIVAAVSMVIHVVTLLFDKFIPFTLVELLVPWASNYQPLVLFGVNLGSLFVALGIIALYVTLAIVVSSLFWIDKKQKIWKFLHIASYFVIAAVFVHALFLGTDTSSGIGQIAWIAGGIAVLVAIIVRLRRVGTTR